MVLLALQFTDPSCADCDTLGSIVKSEDLLEDCKSCCIAAADDTKFVSGVLEYCPHRLG